MSSQGKLCRTHEEKAGGTKGGIVLRNRRGQINESGKVGSWKRHNIDLGGAGDRCWEQERWPRQREQCT